MWGEVVGFYSRVLLSSLLNLKARKIKIVPYYLPTKQNISDAFWWTYMYRTAPSDRGANSWTKPIDFRLVVKYRPNLSQLNRPSCTMYICVRHCDSFLLVSFFCIAVSTMIVNKDVSRWYIWSTVSNKMPSCCWDSRSYCGRRINEWLLR